MASPPISPPLRRPNEYEYSTPLPSIPEIESSPTLVDSPHSYDLRPIRFAASPSSDASWEERLAQHMVRNPQFVWFDEVGDELEPKQRPMFRRRLPLNRELFDQPQAEDGSVVDERSESSDEDGVFPFDDVDLESHASFPTSNERQASDDEEAYVTASEDGQSTSTQSCAMDEAASLDKLYVWFDAEGNNIPFPAFHHHSGVFATNNDDAEGCSTCSEAGSEVPPTPLYDADDEDSEAEGDHDLEGDALPMGDDTPTPTTSAGFTWGSVSPITAEDREWAVEIALAYRRHVEANRAVQVEARDTNTVTGRSEDIHPVAEDQA